MNPFILYNNLFAEGTPTATSTATGYDITNINDWRTFTKWKANVSGTTYLYPNVSGIFDTLCIIGHNLSTCGALISIEWSADNATSWTEIVAPFFVFDDYAICKTFTKIDPIDGLLLADTGDFIITDSDDYISVSSTKYPRIKIVTSGSITPEIAICVLGERTQFPMAIKSMPTLYNIGIVGETSVSKQGNILNTVIKYRPVTITHEYVMEIGNYVWLTGDFKDFWINHGSLMKPFFYVFDNINYPNDTYLMRLIEDSLYTLPMIFRSKATVTNFSLAMEGILEQ